MDSFAYLTTFISIILGLGITYLLTGFAALIRARHRLQMWWPTVLWMTTTFLIHVQTWWALFTLRSVQEWTFAAFLIVLLQPVALFMMAALIVPRVEAGEDVTLRSEYFREYRWYFAALLVALLASLTKNIALTGSLPEPRNLAAHVVFFSLAVAAMLSGSKTAQTVLAVAGLIVLVAYIAVLFAALS